MSKSAVCRREPVSREDGCLTFSSTPCFSPATVLFPRSPQQGSMTVIHKSASERLLTTVSYIEQQDKYMPLPYNEFGHQSSQSQICLHWVDIISKESQAVVSTSISSLMLMEMLGMKSGTCKACGPLPNQGFSRRSSGVVTLITSSHF